MKRPGCGIVVLLIAAASIIGGSLVAPVGADDAKEKKEAAKIDVKSASLADIEKHVAAEKGTPVAMDVWATWCVPCREKFPKFVALAGKLQGKARFLSLSIDEEEQLADAKKFLESKKATFANFLVKDGAEAAQKKFGFEGVPQYVLWDADGKIVLRTEDFAKLDAKLKELLAAKKGDA